MELKTNKNAIIKGADKGGSVVIISTKHYCKMVYHHLCNKQIHKKKTDSTCNNKAMNKIKKLTQKYENILTKLEIDYLTNFSASKSNFYVLPKNHKSPLISEAIAEQNNKYKEFLEPSNLKLRPIVAGPTCSTPPLSDLSDKILKPLIVHVKIC